MRLGIIPSLRACSCLLARRLGKHDPVHGAWDGRCLPFLLVAGPRQRLAHHRCSPSPGNHRRNRGPRHCIVHRGTDAACSSVRAALVQHYDAAATGRFDAFFRAIPPNCSNPTDGLWTDAVPRGLVRGPAQRLSERLIRSYGWLGGLSYSLPDRRHARRSAGALSQHPRNMQAFAIAVWSVFSYVQMLQGLGHPYKPLGGHFYLLLGLTWGWFDRNVRRGGYFGGSRSRESRGGMTTRIEGSHFVIGIRLNGRPISRTEITEKRKTQPLRGR